MTVGFLSHKWILVVFFWLAATPPIRCTFKVGDVTLVSTLLSSEHEILLEFLLGVTKDPGGKLASWNSNVEPNFCKWTGILCDAGERHVVSLNLTDNLLEGNISPAIGRLKFLRSLVLHGNRFTGNVPTSVGLLRGLVHLDLSDNRLEGPLPNEFTNCTGLQFLDISNNHFLGSLPAQLGSLVNLEWFNVRQNDFTGLIPSSLSNCTGLVFIDLGFNHFVGTIPEELGLLVNLETLCLLQNNLRGLLPSSILTGCPELSVLDVSNNGLSGQLPGELGRLKRLRSLRLHGNNLVGSIPPSIGHCLSLTTLVLGPNPLHGTIPVEIGGLKQLITLVITHTDITGSIPHTLGNCTDLKRLQLFNNRLAGIIPADLGNCASLLTLEIANNKLIGRIPSSLGALAHLERFDASHNRLTGEIPRELTNLERLIELHLSDNLLTGSLPFDIGRLKLLEKLNLSSNALSGTLPASLRRCSALVGLNLSGNKISGSVTGEIVRGLRGLSYLNLANNQLTGFMPDELGDLSFIAIIDLSVNQLVGRIPSSLGNCRGLVQLNVSNNRLTGNLPSTLGPLPILTQFSVAHNDLSGPIPLIGIYANLSTSSLAGNPGLCGPQVQRNCTSTYQSPACKGIGCHRRWIYILSGVAGFCLALVGLGVILWVSGWRSSCKGRKNSSKELAIHPNQLQFQLTAEDLWASTHGFSETNIIGVGGYSTVYKGVLPCGMPIAIKKMNFEFDKELTEEHDMANELQILRGLRHKNLLQVYGFVSTLELRALIMEFIPNGSLHVQLHKGETCSLTWSTRVNIAVGVADAMIHLHHECLEPIIHRDLKPSNILLDPDFNARVADFGIAKNVHFGADGETTASGLFGTTGYIAPEYATSNKVSTKGDVYSYGVVILEMLTRKQPTDDSFSPGTWLSLWVLKAFPDTFLDVLDPSLKGLYRTSAQREVHMLIRIGLLCTQDVPSDRPSMLEVREMLAEIRDPSWVSAAGQRYPSMAELAGLQNGIVHHHPTRIESPDTATEIDSTLQNSTLQNRFEGQEDFKPHYTPH